MINQEMLKEVLHYDADSGIFYWKKSFNNGVKIGDRADSNKGHSYVRISIKGRKYYAHRLAWFYVYGEWPIYEIDHINHDRTDNRIVNLRHVNRIDNSKNMSIGKLNTSGYTGVYFSKQRKKWIAFIRNQGVVVNLGGYIDKCDAINARREAQIKFSYHNNHGESIDNGEYQCVRHNDIDLAKNNIIKQDSYVWVIDGNEFKSPKDAALHYNVTDTTIKNWCLGYKSHQYTYQKKNNCYRIPMYQGKAA